MKKKMLSVILVTVIMAAIASGCSSKEEETKATESITTVETDNRETTTDNQPSADKETKAAESESNAEGDESLSYILDKGTFVLGLDTSFPPMGFLDKEQNIIGFDIDVAAEVARRLGVRLVLQPISWDAKELELSAKNIDCIWNGMSVNDDRKANLNLSDTYMENKQVVVVLADSSISLLQDLSGKTVVIQNGSTAQDAMEGNEELLNSIGTLTKVEDNIKAMLDLKIQSSDAVVMDEVVARYYTTLEANEGQYKILDETLSDEEYAVGFRKGDDELTEKVNRILQEMAQDGSLAQISQTWFGSDITVISK